MHAREIIGKHPQVRGRIDDTLIAASRLAMTAHKLALLVPTHASASKEASAGILLRPA